MMTYFILSNSTNEKEVGKSYPQCKGMPSGMGLTKGWFEQPNSMTKLKNSEFPNFDPDLRFELEENAILTDLVSPSNISARGLLLSERAKNILSSFKIIEHKFYPATIKYQGVDHQYFWFHPVVKNLEGIDFSSSKFHVTNLAYMKVRELDISSYDEYIREKKELKMKHIRADKLSLTKDFINNSYDIFMFPLIHSNIFISKEIATEIHDKRLTGFNIAEQGII